MYRNSRYVINRMCNIQTLVMMKGMRMMMKRRRRKMMRKRKKRSNS